MKRREDIIWMAGFFDGEGSVSIHQPRSENRIRLSIRVCNTVEEALWVFVKRYGGRISSIDRNPQSKRMYRWGCPPRNHVRLLKDLLPFLIIKKERVKLALRFRETVRKMNSKLQELGERRSISSEVWSKRIDLLGEMKRLNTRGRVLNEEKR